MEKFNKIIALLMAIANFAKDIHYNVSGSAAYSKHLFADLLQDDVYDFIDEIKENVFLAAEELPLASGKYLEMAIPLIPEIAEDDKVSFERIRGLIEKTNKALEEIKEAPSRGVGSLLDSISEHLDKCLGLLFLQVRKVSSVNEDFKKEENRGQDEKPVDREKAEWTPINREEVAKTVKENEAQNLLVAEDTLDKLSKRLGV
jgi:DNA-binding ferritin-like protein